MLTNIGKAQDDVARLSSAEAASTELEGLSSLLQFGHLSVEDGVKLYQQYSAKIPFVDDQPGGAPARAGARLLRAPAARSGAVPPAPARTRAALRAPAPPQHYATPPPGHYPPPPRH